MTTPLEILDTAVKLGLGALIGGLSSYFLAKDKAKLDSRKSKQDDVRSLLKAIAASMATANSALEDYMHLTFIPDQSRVCESLSKNASLLNDAAKHLDQAHTMATLTGSESLRDTLQSTVEAMYRFHREYASIDPSSEYESTKMEELVEQFNQTYKQSLDALQATYADTAA